MADIEKMHPSSVDLTIMSLMIDISSMTASLKAVIDVLLQSDKVDATTRESCLKILEAYTASQSTFRRGVTEFIEGTRAGRAS
jgi:hypothetical protein